MKGQHLRIFIKQGNGDAKCIAFAQSMTYHLSANLEDSSTKDDTGDFQKQAVVGMAGDFSCDALYSVETDATGVNGEDALDLVLAGQEVTVEFSGTTGDKNRTQTGNKYTCAAIINDISVNSGNRQNVTYSIQGQFNSKPVKS